MTPIRIAIAAAVLAFAALPAHAEMKKEWVEYSHDGTKRLDHPDVGRLELAYRSLDLPMPHRTVHDLTFYTAEPGTTSEDRLKLLASWTATPPPDTEAAEHTR